MTFIKLYHLLNKDSLVSVYPLFHTNTLHICAKRDILTLWFQAKTLASWQLWNNLWTENMEKRLELCTTFGWTWNIFLCLLTPSESSEEWHLPGPFILDVCVIAAKLSWVKPRWTGLNTWHGSVIGCRPPPSGKLSPCGWGNPKGTETEGCLLTGLVTAETTVFRTGSGQLIAASATTGY